MSQTPFKPPLRRRINVRIIAFTVIVASIPLWVLYTYISDMTHQGIAGDEDGYTRVELKWLSSFDFDQVYGTINDVPKRFRELDGKKVIFTGEIAPTSFSSRAANEFDIVYSVAKCCYSGPPQVQHFVQSRMRNGGEATLYGGLIEAKGTLHVRVIPGEGKVAGVYQLDLDSLRPAGGDFPMWIIYTIISLAGAAGIIFLSKRIGSRQKRSGLIPHGTVGGVQPTTSAP
jgi:hypothetical protein